MLDEITITARIAKKLRELFDTLKSENNQQLDNAITTFQTVANEKVDQRISELNGEVTEKANTTLSGINNDVATRSNTILDQVKLYAQTKTNEFINGFSEIVTKAVNSIKKDAQEQIKETLSNVKKGDKGDKGDSIKGDTGDQGVGIQKIDQPSTESMRIVLTDGKEFPIKLPRGPKGSGGGGGMSGAAGISVVQEFYSGVENFPLEGQAQITYFDTSKTPYESYIWTGSEYVLVGGGGGDTGYKNPVYTYTGDDLTRIDYSTGEFQVLTYDADGEVQTIDVTDSEGTTRFTFSYNPDGSLASVTESII